MWPPYLRCPDDISIIAKKGSPAEVVSWKVDTNDNSLSVDSNAKVTVHSSHVSPHNFTIGRHEVYVSATDTAGNSRRCQFSIIIRGNLMARTCVSIVVTAGSCIINI